MANRLPVQAPPAPRAVYYYPDPATRQDLVYRTEAQTIARQRAQRVAYARWVVRQAQIAEHDRKVRRFLLGFGAVVGTAVLTGLAVLGWLVYHVATGVSGDAVAGLLGVLATFGAISVVGVIGHRCITVVQHWH